MDFNRTEQQTMLLTMARDFLASANPKSRIRELEKDEKGYDPGMWRRMAELGWMGLVLPEQYGGSGADFMDLVVLMEEMGRNLLPGPFFATVVLAALPILEYGNDEQKAKHLLPIARGEEIWTLAAAETDKGCNYSAIRTTARPDDSGYTLNGEKAFVPCAGAADYMLVLAHTGRGKTLDRGLTLFIVDGQNPGVKTEPILTLTGEKLCQVSYKNVKLGTEDVLGTPGKAGATIEAILEKAGLLKCAEVSGACQAVLDMTCAYAKERVQFGRPIGAFQAIQHKLVHMLTDVEGLQYLVYQAAWLMGMGMPCSEQVAIAKIRANEVYQRVALDGVKIHGAIGFSRDHDIGMYYRRVLASRFFPYDTAYYLEKVADSIGL